MGFFSKKTGNCFSPSSKNLGIHAESFRCNGESKKFKSQTQPYWFSAVDLPSTLRNEIVMELVKDTVTQVIKDVEEALELKKYLTSGSGLALVFYYNHVVYSARIGSSVSGFVSQSGREDTHFIKSSRHLIKANDGLNISTRSIGRLGWKEDASEGEILLSEPEISLFPVEDFERDNQLFLSSALVNNYISNQKLKKLFSSVEPENLPKKICQTAGESYAQRYEHNAGLEPRRCRIKDETGITFLVAPINKKVPFLAFITDGYHSDFVPKYLRANIPNIFDQKLKQSLKAAAEQAEEGVTSTYSSSP